MSWQVVSFFTENTGYAAEIKKLEASLVALGLPYHFFPRRPTGTWRGNLNHKSAVIMEAFELFPNVDIVFLDADAIVRSRPVLFDDLSARQEFDIAAHFFNYSFAKDELLSGTLWIANRLAGWSLVKHWHAKGLSHPEIRHQECLKLSLTETPGARVYRLPLEYTCIYDHPARRGKTAVIEHFQASRRFRRQVGWGVNLIHRPTNPPPKKMLQTASRILK
jgi:hypothetical protein